MALVAVNDDDLVGRPAQSQRSLAQTILAFGAFLVLLNLAQGGLPHVQEGLPAQMFCLYFLGRFAVHGTLAFSAAASTSSLNSWTKSRWTIGGTVEGAAGPVGDAPINGANHGPAACIQAATPRLTNTAWPQRDPPPEFRPKACSRTFS